MEILIIIIVIWSFTGAFIFLTPDYDTNTDWFSKMNWPQYFFVAFLFGPIIFIGALVNFIYVMLGKINWK